MMLLTVSMFVWTAPWISARSQTDSLAVSLGEVQVTGPTRRNFRVTDDAGLTLNAADMADAPHYFGETDMLRHLFSAGGINAISDYSSGASIDGMDYSQNIYTLCGVPVQFPYHFGGIFSTFSSAMYPSLRLWKSIHPAGSPDCLGGIASVDHQPQSEKQTRGSANIGMLASSLFIEQPFGGGLNVAASGRISYIDALYHDLLTSSETDIRYGFHDLDFAVSHTNAAGDRLQLVVHHNADKLSYADDNYAMETSLKWRNTLAGVSWSGKYFSATAYYTEFSNRIALDMQQLVLEVPSYIRQAGAEGRFSRKFSKIGFSTGISLNYYNTSPQSIELVGFGNNQHRPSTDVNATVTKAWASVAIPLNKKITIEAGVDCNSLFSMDGYGTFDIDPRVTLKYTVGLTRLSAHIGRYHQYLHQVGFSEIGMSSNFKIAATREIPAQQSLNFVVTASRMIPSLDLKINGDIYYKLVYDQPEYYGGVLDLLNADYRPEKYIDNCDGFNTGLTLSISRDFSALTASASYSFGIARRKAPGADEYFTASSEIRHALNLSAAYTFGQSGHWSVGAAFAFASGRPVTPVRSVYFIGERIMVEYGTRNASRLPAYHRLDLTAAYKFTTGRLRHRATIALINAYGHRNIEISSYRFDTATGGLYRRDIASLYRFLPSVSYTVEF